MSDLQHSEPEENLSSPHLTSVGRRSVSFAAAVLAAIAVLMGVDIFSDARTGVNPMHLAAEGIGMVAALVGAAVLWRGLRAAEARATKLDIDLEAARREAARFRAEAQEALRGLGQAIDSQFERWGLTPAEREVGILLLKGLSHREVAEIRHTSEATVRQQALSIYRKAGLRNRSDLSAFFLEDLLLPAHPDVAGSTSPPRAR